MSEMTFSISNTKLAFISKATTICLKNWSGKFGDNSAKSEPISKTVHRYKQNVFNSRLA